MSLRIATLSELPIQRLYARVDCCFFNVWECSSSQIVPLKLLKRKYIVSINLTWMTRLCKLLISNHPLPSISGLAGSHHLNAWACLSGRRGLKLWKETMIFISQFYQYMNSIHSIALSFTKSSQKKNAGLVDTSHPNQHWSLKELLETY